MIQTVRANVCDLRRIPSYEKTEGRHDRNLDSQLIFGETLRVLNREKGWCFVEALEQLRYTEKWEPYKGWVPEEAISPSESSHVWNTVVTTLHPQYSMGTRFQRTGSNSQQETLRKSDLFSIGTQLLGRPYLWGGRSSFAAGIDCSGLTNLLYRLIGIDIPRDAQDQYLFAKSTSFSALKSGDLIFHAESDKSPRINHVLLYDGKGGALEATEISNTVRSISLEQRYGENLSTFNSGDDVGSYTLYFATIC